MNRDEFLATVKSAAESGRAHRVKTRDLPATVGYVGCGDDRCAALATEVTAVGGEAIVCRDDTEARQTLLSLLADLKVQTAFCWEHRLLQRLQLPDLLAEREVVCLRHGLVRDLTEPARLEAILAADIGISSVDFAVAETGSLVVCSQPGQERMVSLLPPVHVAVVDESQIVPDLYDVFTGLHERGVQLLPSNLAFITGPSKTGDIELQLTTGVHGPGRWIVVIIRGSET